jgi:hypothetical protein
METISKLKQVPTAARLNLNLFSARQMAENVRTALLILYSKTTGSIIAYL